MYAHAYLSQEKAVGPLELEFQIILSFPMWCWKLNSFPIEEKQVLSNFCSPALPLKNNFPHKYHLSKFLTSAAILPYSLELVKEGQSK